MEEMVNPRSRSTRTRSIVIIFVVFVVAFVIGLLIGRYAICTKEDSSSEGQSKPVINEDIIREADPTIGDEIIQQINSDNIRQYLRCVYFGLLVTH